MKLTTIFILLILFSSCLGYKIKKKPKFDVKTIVEYYIAKNISLPEDDGTKEAANKRKELQLKKYEEISYILDKRDKNIIITPLIDGSYDKDTNNYEIIIYIEIKY